MTISFYWIDPDAGEVQLGQVSTSRVREFSGLGMAPPQHFLEPIPSQHRQAHRGLKFRPRIVQLSLRDIQASATAQDTRHQTLLTALNPGRGEGTLKMVLSDGSTTRYLDCRVQEGPNFDSADRPLWGASQLYTVRFVARDPMLYNPVQNSEYKAFNGATPADLAITNSGHIEAYPTISIAVGAENPKVQLLSTGEYVEFESYTVPAGGPLNIDCWAGTVKLADGTDKMSELSKPSTLFYLPSGSDTLRLTAAAGTNALCTVTWYSRFLGL